MKAPQAGTPAHTMAAAGLIVAPMAFAATTVEGATELPFDKLDYLQRLVLLRREGAPRRHRDFAALRGAGAWELYDLRLQRRWRLPGGWAPAPDGDPWLLAHDDGRVWPAPAPPAGQVRGQARVAGGARKAGGLLRGS